MISLKKLAADGLIKLTDARRKYTIDGVQRLEAIYRIPLKYLYYNNQNGRISTALQKYVSGHPEVVLNPALDDENPEYNDLFESFVFNYIVYFISLSRYDYTHHSMDKNRAYHTLAIIRLSDYNYIDKV